MSSINETTGQPASFHLPLDIFAITTFICTAFYIFLYSILIKQESFLLHTFKERIIGVSVLDGVDVAARTRLYLFALILTGILALVLLLLLEKIIDTIIPKEHFGKERCFLTILSIFGTTNLLCGILTKNSVFLFNIYVILCLVLCVLTLIVVKKYGGVKKPQNLLLFDDLTFISSIILAPVTGIFALLVLMGGAFAISFTIFIVYYGVFLLLLVSLVVYCPNRFPQILDNNYRGIVVNSLLPLSVYPVSIPLTNEFQYWLSQWISVDPRTLSLGFLFLVVIICFLLFKIQVMKNHPFLTPKSSLENIIFPSLLAAFSLYVNYKPAPPFAQIQIINLFEHGLTSTVVQQFFDFGKIPNIHLVSPHGFSDIYYAILYSFFNGYQPADCFLWQWITPVLIALAGYFFFKEFVEGHVAFLLMLFLPVFGILTFNNFFILIPAIFFVRFWKDPRLKNYLVLLIACLFCFAWRVEAGVASVLAFVLISIFLFFPLVKKTPAQLWKNYSMYFYATAGILGLCVLSYVALCVITGISPLYAFQSVVNLYSIQEIRGAYPSLYSTYDTRVALQYAIFPLFGLGVLIFFIWSVVARRKTITAQFILIAFITLGSLFLSQRGIQRHSQIEFFSYYYFPLIACSLPLLWYRTRQVKSIILLILILGGGFFIAQYPLTTIHGDYSQNFFEFRTWGNHENRVQIQENDITPVVNLTEYLKDHLRPNETYYDMSNYMIPYTLLRKEYLPYSVFHMLQTGEYNQDETIKILNQNNDRIPIVVTGGWQADGIPNELRTYRIAEYVFTHYKPLGKIDSFELWIRNDLNSSDFVNPPVIADITIVRDYNLKNLPYFWGTFDTSDPVSNQPVQEVIFHGEQKIIPDSPPVFSAINSSIDKTSGNYLLITLKSESNGNITLVYGNLTDDVVPAPATIRFNTIPSDEKQNYLIRISSQWNWYAGPVTHIELKSSTPITLYECKILKGD